MPKLSYKPDFSDDVATGKKRCTIRKKRKTKTIKLGSRLFHFETATDKPERKLGESLCTKLESITITTWLEVRQNGVCLSIDEVEALAIQDGFKSTKEFFDFLKKQYAFPFEGELISWETIIHDKAKH